MNSPLINSLSFKYFNQDIYSSYNFKGSHPSHYLLQHRLIRHLHRSILPLYLTPNEMNRQKGMKLIHYKFPYLGYNSNKGLINVSNKLTNNSFGYWIDVRVIFIIHLSICLIMVILCFRACPGIKPRYGLDSAIFRVGLNFELGLGNLLIG